MAEEFEFFINIPEFLMNSQPHKFRIYNHRTCEFEYFTVEKLLYMLNEQQFPFVDSIQKYSNPKQYSGVKDKDGVEIYAGDIVEKYGQILIVKHGFHDNGERWEDNVSGNGWYLAKSIDTDVPKGDLFYPEEIKVIGNIFDNPELITRLGNRLIDE